MKILITGGHLTPALAVIQQLPKDVQIIYVGREHALEGDMAVSLEYHVIRDMNIPFIPFQPAKLQRKLTKHTFPSLARIPTDIFKALSILKKERPDVVLSFGGHVALPFGIAACLLRIPLIIHEQTREVGVTNKFLAKYATKICISWQSSKKFFPEKKVILTGNPIPTPKPSEEIQKLLEEAPQKYPLITITGGSLGSHPINALIEPILEKLLAKYILVHQTGDAREYDDFIRLSAFKESLPYTFQERYILQKFIQPDDVTYIYGKSDLVLSRAGINTVLILLLENIPSLLIPLPVSQRGEQQKNAELLQDAGLGEVLLQDTLTSEKLLQAIDMMMEKRKSYTNAKLEEMQQLHSHAAENIINVVYDSQNNTHSSKT